MSPGLGIHPLLYRFVRYCVNRAYLNLDDSKLSADERYSLETILQNIRQAEDEWQSVDDVIKFISEEIPRIYRQALERLPEGIVDELFKNILNNCKDLDEVRTNPKILSAIDEVLNRLGEVKKKLLEESRTRIYEPSA
ncbi:MAG: hypothetical protein L7H10_05820 [Vulcanisaeta sp.]|jgi:hypothetical protein|nr:hypothetical protein [Vulcanisaeta sp.]MCG2870252.1 hypothetical protein [Vulcanisaeta sp.]MCG2887309.1 hypothetical protein [Vulcanisaeta sp.]